MNDGQLQALAYALQHGRNGLVEAMQASLDLGAVALLNATVTIDFKAQQALGTPVVVIQHAPQIDASWMSKLTPREISVAELILAGESNKLIARNLGISLATVKDHVHRILQKAGVPSRAALCGTATGRRGELNSLSVKSTMASF